MVTTLEINIINSSYLKTSLGKIVIQFTMHKRCFIIK